MSMNQNIIDQINSLSQVLCTQPISNEMISLRQLKARNFLATTASRHYKIPEIEEPKLKKKQQNLAKIQFKFQIEDEDYHSVLRELIQLQKNRNPLLPLQLHYKPNTSLKGLSIGKITNEDEVPKPLTLDEYRLTLKTQKINRDNRDTSQPILEEFNRQLSQPKMNITAPCKIFTDRSKSSKVHIGPTFQPSSTQAKQFEVEFDMTPSTSYKKKRITQKQFNLYKNRKIATPNLAFKFKKIKEEELSYQKRVLKEKEKEYEKTFFDQL